MPLPFFVIDETGYVEVADSASDAAGLIEVYDIAEVQVFDYEGNRYRAVDAGNWRVQLVATGESAPTLLDGLLRTFFTQHPMNQYAEGDDLRLTVANALREWQWSRRWPRRPEWLDRRLHGAPPPPFSRRD